MKNMRKTNDMKVRRTICFALSALFIFAAVIALFAGCGKVSSDQITSLSQLNEKGRKIGVASDTAEDRLVMEVLPNAKVEYFKDDMSAYTSVSQGKIDAFVFNRIAMETAIYNGMSGVRLLDETVGEGNKGAVAISPVTKIPDLEGKINTFLAELKADGTLEDMKQRWLIKHDEKLPDIPVLKTSDIHLTVATSGMNMPFTYYVGTELGGYDIELAMRFAAWLGATLEFKVYDYESIVAAALTGDVDCIFANLFITPERQESIRFSEPTFVGEVGVMVRDTETKSITSLSELEHANIAVMTGTNFPEHVLKALPEAKILYYNTMADALNALKSKKADAVANDEPSARYMMAQDKTVTYLPDLLEALDYGYIFQKSDKGEALCNELSDYISQMKSDGTLKALQDKWVDAEDVAEVDAPDYRMLPATNGTVSACTIDGAPFTFLKDGGLQAGYEIELLYLFCRDNGYGMTVTEVSMDALISAVQSGKYDTACCAISITEERKESMLFSEPDYSGGTVLMVRNEGADENLNFFESVAESFKKTFIRENRWKLFLKGIGTTFLITVMSIILGTLLGFFVFMACRNGNPAANAIARFCVWLIRGMPVVVLLMILYYIIFGNVAVSGTLVSIIGFTLVFAAGTFESVKSAVSAIDKGQLEAAYALGYTNFRAFFRVILPQALPYFMPAYKGSITELIKATAIVGYVAVQDLTKMGDIVRSRTYEAFFPLIAVAIIYFILAAILTFIVKRVEFKIDPKRRKREKIVKGVSGK